MTAAKAGHRGLLIGLLYVALCTGLATLLVLGIAPTVAFPTLLVLMLPAGIVPFAVAMNIVFVVDGLPMGSAGQLAFVSFVAAVALLQMWMFRTIARYWRRSDPDLRPEPVTATPVSGG